MTSFVAGYLVKSALSVSQRLSPINYYQQVRHSRKQHRLLACFYGRVPIITDDQYHEAKERGLEELAFEKFRFPLLGETCSPLFDRKLEDFIESILRGGKKQLVQHLMHMTLYRIKVTQLKKLRKQREKEAEAEAQGKTLNVDYDSGEFETNPIEIVHRALKNAQPLLVTRKIRRGGAIYQVPFPVTPVEAKNAGFKWLEEAVKDRPKPRDKTFDFHMAAEMIDCAMNRGKVVKRRDDLHKLAVANKAYSHYRWG